MLEVCSLTKRYSGALAVENVDFVIRPDENDEHLYAEARASHIVIKG